MPTDLPFEINLPTAFLVFALTAMMDALHAVYTKAVATNQAGRAASFGSVIYLISGFAVIQYTRNHVYLLFIVAGSWIGVYLSVKMQILLERKQKTAPPDGNA